jgi:hypothetical protein
MTCAGEASVPISIVGMFRAPTIWPAVPLHNQSSTKTGPYVRMIVRMPGHRMPFVIPLDRMIQLQHPSVRFGGPDTLAHTNAKTVLLETLCERGRGFHAGEILGGEDLEFPGVCLGTMNRHAAREFKEIEAELKDALLTDREIGESKHRDDIMEVFVFRSGHRDPMEARV